MPSQHVKSSTDAPHKTGYGLGVFGGLKKPHVSLTPFMGQSLKERNTLDNDNAKVKEEEFIVSRVLLFTTYTL